MYLVFTRMPGESYRRRLRSLLLYLYGVFIGLPLFVDSVKEENKYASTEKEKKKRKKKRL